MYTNYNYIPSPLVCTTPLGSSPSAPHTHNPPVAAINNCSSDSYPLPAVLCRLVPPAPPGGAGGMAPPATPVCFVAFPNSTERTLQIHTYTH